MEDFDPKYRDEVDGRLKEQQASKNCNGLFTWYAWNWNLIKNNSDTSNKRRFEMMQMAEDPINNGVDYK